MSLKAARPHPFAAPTADVAKLQSSKVDSTTLLLPALARSSLDSAELVRVTQRRHSSAVGATLLFEISNWI